LKLARIATQRAGIEIPEPKGRKSNALKMREKRKDPKPKYGFLFDRDVSKAASFFPAKRVRTIEQVGLPENATDSEIVRKASDLGLIIVTAT
jgi:hypothetical protein